jgi:hypothetical protein
LAESIREYGVLQPVLVRPISSIDMSELQKGPRIIQLGNEWSPNYVLVAGNRRHMAAERSGREYVPAVIRVVDRDQAFALNIVENIQREELSGRERIRAIEMLANLRDETNQPYSTRELASLVEKDHASTLFAPFQAGPACFPTPDSPASGVSGFAVVQPGRASQPRTGTEDARRHQPASLTCTMS